MLLCGSWDLFEFECGVFVLLRIGYHYIEVGDLLPILDLAKAYLSAKVCWTSLLTITVL